MQQLALDIAFAPAPSLNDFVAGANAQAVQHLGVWVGNGAGHSVRSRVPTYLWGESGTGKTHLLCAIRADLERQGARMGWLSPALAEPPAFDSSWNVVFFDDVHLYNPVQQQAAFSWFVQAVSSPASDASCGVLAAGLLPPADLPIRDDLRTRLGWGHVFKLEALDDAARRDVLRRAASGRGLQLGDDVLDYVLTRFSRDLTSLTGLLDRLDAYSLRTQRAATVPMVKAMLDNETNL